jgi:hypothetical protein
MGESGEPWGVPCEMLKDSEVEPLKVMRMVRSVKNERSHAVIEGGNPRLETMWTRRSTLRLSKNPEISNRMTAATASTDGAFCLVHEAHRGVYCTVVIPGAKLIVRY